MGRLTVPNVQPLLDPVDAFVHAVHSPHDGGAVFGFGRRVAAQLAFHVGHAGLQFAQVGRQAPQQVKGSLRPLSQHFQGHVPRLGLLANRRADSRSSANRGKKKELNNHGN